MIIHASDLNAWSRCPQAFAFDRISGLPGEQLSRTAYGTVMHRAVEVLEREGDLEKAITTFDWYWHPHNIEAVTQPVSIWLGKDTYGSLRARGIETLKRYHDLMRFDDAEKLALEFEFVVPLEGTIDRNTGSHLYLGGQIDKLSARFIKRFPVIEIADFKTGKQYTYLRQNVQGTLYAFASTQREFWTGNAQFHTEGFGQERGEYLFNRFANHARKFTWVNLSDSVKLVDGGWRGPNDYERLRRAVQAVADSIYYKTFPLSISGENCTFCSYRKPCGASDEDHGNPARRAIHAAN